LTSPVLSILSTLLNIFVYRICKESIIDLTIKVLFSYALPLL
jgi:hypothetical protein